MEKLNVAVIGCGLIGTRRARTVFENPRSSLVLVVDPDEKKSTELSNRYGCLQEKDWQKAVSSPGIDLVVVSTPNHLLCEISCLALKNGKDVLIEKPMGKNLKEAVKIRDVARRNKRRLKVGFNHRYHPAIEKARKLFEKGIIGKPVNLRCQYGHGGRKGYEKEWRGNLKTAGGGELTDQGVHLIDLIQWFLGKPQQAFAFLQSAFWPIHPLEDNGFALLKFKNGPVANFHSSWTQWKNLFNFELTGTKGTLSINGLGGSYGPETLKIALRKHPGDVPEIKILNFDEEDHSWKLEWEEFLSAVLNHRPYLGNAEEGVAVMKTLDALYRSSRTHKVIPIL